jgi:adenylate cyclase
MLFTPFPTFAQRGRSRRHKGKWVNESRKTLKLTQKLVPLKKSEMALEIERKFLVKGEFRHLAIKKTDISQGYLSVDPGRTVRVRITDDRAVLSVKAPLTGTDISRHEWEYEIPADEAGELMNACLPEVVRKTRYIVPELGHLFEVDVFHGKNEGLIIAELELTSEDQDFARPAWLGEEVTGLAQYYSSNLI